MSHIGSYTVVGQLSAGAVGVTYSVSNDTGRAILKDLYHRLAKDQGLLARLHGDVDIAMALSGESSDIGLGNLLDFGAHGDGRFYLVYEHIDGEPLAALLAARALPIREALFIAQRLAQALAALHRAGLCHGAVHPGNVFIKLDEDGNPRPVLVDLSLAHAYAAARRAATPLGDGIEDRQRAALAYLAPEPSDGSLASGGPADCFALGSILARLLGLRDLPVPGWPRSAPAWSGGQWIGGQEAARALCDELCAPQPGWRPTAQQAADRISSLLHNTPGFERRGALRVDTATLGVRAASAALRLRDQRPGVLLELPPGSPLRMSDKLPHIPQRGFAEVTLVTLEREEALFLAHPIDDLQPLPHGPLPPHEALRVAVEVAVALQAAHERGVLYLGLRPEALLVGKDHAVLLLPRAETQSSRQPGGPVSGASPYAAPEQQRGGALGEKTDVFGLAALLYALLCGGPPAAVPALDHLPRDLRELLRWALAEAPSARPSLLDFTAALRFQLRLAKLLHRKHLGKPGEEERYLLKAQLGTAGGFGAVFLAYDNVTCIDVAIKVPHPHFTHDQVLREWDKARRVNTTGHPGIVVSYEILRGHDDEDYACIVMEYVRGQTLRSILDDQPPPLALERVLRLCDQIAAAMAAIHALPGDLAHCDLKPENLMVVADEHVEGGERVRILDFGIARLTTQFRSTQRLLQGEGGGAAGGERAVVGTPFYMAPEVWLGEISTRVDVYALAVILVELLSPPVDLKARTPIALPLPASLVVPPWLRGLLTQMLGPASERPTMAEVKVRLRQQQQVPPPPPRLWAYAAALAAVVLGALGVGHLVRGPEWRIASQPAGAAVTWEREGQAGGELGVTPLALRPRRTIPGAEPVTLRLRLDGYEDGVIDLRPQEAALREVALTPLPARLVSRPAGVAVHDAGTGALLGKTPYRFLASVPPAGKPPGAERAGEVELRLAGFAPLKVRLQARPGQSQVVILQRLARGLRVTPAEAQIFDGASGKLLGTGAWRCDAEPTCAVTELRVSLTGFEERVLKIPPLAPFDEAVELKPIGKPGKPVLVPPPPPRCTEVAAACLPKTLVDPWRAAFVEALKGGAPSLCHGEILALRTQGGHFVLGRELAAPERTMAARAFLLRLRGLQTGRELPPPPEQVVMRCQ